MKAYITKFALTKGILEVEAEMVIEDRSMIMVKGYNQEPGRYVFSTFYHKTEWAPTMEEAKIQAEKMKKNKIDNLKKQIDKLEKLTF